MSGPQRCVPGLTLGELRERFPEELMGPRGWRWAAAASRSDQVSRLRDRLSVQSAPG